MDKSEDEEVVVGIDLGTTYCCIAAYRKGRMLIINNDMGNRLTPSYITIKGQKTIYVGDVSKDLAHEDPQKTIFDVKRLIGRNFYDPQIQSDIRLWPFQVVDDDQAHGVPKIKVDNRTYYPEEISAKLLRHLKKIAEDGLGLPVKKAVVTVPAYFNASQRQATKDAGRISGLEILQIINEPTAAAIAYNLHENSSKSNRKCLMFDLGGGTFDVVVLVMNDRLIEIKAVDGHSHLGGEDFDYEMVNYCIDQFRSKHSIDLNEKINSIDITEQNRALKAIRRLKTECQKQKEFLSSVNKVTVSLDVLFGGKDLIVYFDQQLFCQLNSKRFQKCLKIVDQVLKCSKINKNDINDVVLVGGSCKIPKIQEMLREYFGPHKLRREIDPDEAVARGAAILGAQLELKKGKNFITIERGNKFVRKQNSKIDQTDQKIIIKDVVHLPIGLQMQREGREGRNFSVLIEKNTQIPCTITKEYVTVKNEQEEIEIHVYQGEGKTTEENHFLGNFKLTRIPKCPEGEPVIVTMQVDLEGILHVAASMTRHPVVSKLVIVESKGRLTEEQINQLQIRDRQMKINPDDVEDFDEDEIELPELVGL